MEGFGPMTSVPPQKLVQPATPPAAPETRETAVAAPTDVLARLRAPFTERPVGRLLDDAAAEIERLRRVEAAARNVAETLNGGFVVCGTCGDQETTTDLDYAPELYAALGIRMSEKTPW